MTESEPQLVTDFNAPLKGGRKTKKHGKRHGNASLRAWVTFVKKVAKEEKLSYRDAMMRAKARKDKGEKWMKGGVNTADYDVAGVADVADDNMVSTNGAATTTATTAPAAGVDYDSSNFDDILNADDSNVDPDVVAVTKRETLADKLRYDDEQHSETGSQPFPISGPTGGRRRRRSGRKTHRKKSHKKRRCTKKRRCSRRH
jgi:hypothetical protein